MAKKHGSDFRKEAVRLALTSGLTRKQLSEDLGVGFLYLVAIMDWHSRKVLSWRLPNTMEADFW